MNRSALGAFDDVSRAFIVQAMGGGGRPRREPKHGHQKTWDHLRILPDIGSVSKSPRSKCRNTLLAADGDATYFLSSQQASAPSTPRMRGGSRFTDTLSSTAFVSVEGGTASQQRKFGYGPKPYSRKSKMLQGLGAQSMLPAGQGGIDRTAPMSPGRPSQQENQVAANFQIGGSSPSSMDSRQQPAPDEPTFKQVPKSGSRVIRQESRKVTEAPDDFEGRNSKKANRRTSFESEGSNHMKEDGYAAVGSTEPDNAEPQAEDPVRTSKRQSSKSMHSSTEMGETDDAVPATPAAGNHRNGSWQPGDEQGDTPTTSEAPPTGSSLEDFWASCFDKVKEGTELHHADLPKALEAAGFVCPNISWIQDIAKGITSFASFDIHEFLEFTRRYKEKQLEAYTAAFAKCDSDGSGYVEVHELASLLKSIGTEPMSHVLDEVIREVDEDGRGTLDFQEFEKLMDLILAREGFTKSECDTFVGIFSRNVREDRGWIETRDLVHILNWLGFAWDQERTQEVVDEVDDDRTGTINLREYLRCMRIVREKELQRVRQIIDEISAENKRAINKDDLPSMLRKMGYDILDSAVVYEAATEAGLSRDQLTLEEAWRLLLVFRQKEGFSTSEIKKIDEVFDKHDRDLSGDLTAMEATRALRDLGYLASFEVMQSVVSKVDVDDTGEVDAVEFRKMIRILQDMEVTQYREAFNAADTENEGLLSVAVASQTIASLGFNTTKKFVETMGFMACSAESLFAPAPAKVLIPAKPSVTSEQKLQEKLQEKGGGMILDTFVRTCRMLSHDARERRRQNGGWSESEVREFKTLFDRYDTKQTGSLASRELVKLVEDLFPGLANDRSIRPQLQEMMKQVSQTASGCLIFKDFLQLMQLFREFRDRERVAKEEKAIRDSRFNTNEVQGFRELFLEADTAASGQLSFEEFRKMLALITPLGDALTTELHRIFLEVAHKRPVPAGYKRNVEVDFPEFLGLMKVLLDANFANIKNAGSSGRTKERSSDTSEAHRSDG
eukprot:TRINITY_DN25084_c0_g1_i1.p1 TRINITY_DN25084_c0_g1~~TRINITY_DN25084_c0_g1_i1.p1  ORF type:complete len:1009 (-),score=230.53 TRINITY_DN25084_c0_g1_i1:2-3028(-)